VPGRKLRFGCSPGNDFYFNGCTGGEGATRKKAVGSARMALQADHKGKSHSKKEKRGKGVYHCKFEKGANTFHGGDKAAGQERQKYKQKDLKFFCQGSILTTKGEGALKG